MQQNATTPSLFFPLFDTRRVPIGYLLGSMGNQKKNNLWVFWKTEYPEVSYKCIYKYTSKNRAGLCNTIFCMSTSLWALSMSQIRILVWVDSICFCAHTHTHTHTHIYIYPFLVHSSSNHLIVLIWLACSPRYKCLKSQTTECRNAMKNGICQPICSMNQYSTLLHNCWSNGTTIGNFVNWNIIERLFFQSCLYMFANMTWSFFSSSWMLQKSFWLLVFTILKP
jgi:hypothetical protein